MSYTIARCQIVRETDNAICINRGSGEAMWFPLSQVEKIVRGRPGSQWCDALVVSDWIAREKSLDNAAWCDDCRSYVHRPDCPSADGGEFPPVDKVLK